MGEIIEIEETADGREIELALNQTLRIVLRETPTAGYRWNLREPGAQVCSVTREDFDPPAGTGAGGSGRRHWEFRAEKTGSARIVIEYGRPWERAAARSFSVSIRVPSTR